MSNKQSFDFVKAMSQYGIILGWLVGFFGTIPLTLTRFDLSMIFPVIAVLLIFSMSGGLVGLLYGAVSGYVSGVLIAVVTWLVFQDIKRHAVYKFMLGTITFGVTLMIILAGQMWLSIDFEQVLARSISATELQSLGIMSLIFAVYASQRVATDYLRDMDLR
jgi:hypothetical protein